MKSSQNITRILAVTLAFFIMAPIALLAQVRYQGTALKTSFTGTSTLHDWEMKSDKGQCDAVITVTGNNVTVSGLSFLVPVESYKSGKGAMDKNTYKAMNTGKHANVTFILTSVTSIATAGSNIYTFKGAGKLTIAGTTKVTDISATLKYNPTDKSFTCTGTKKFKMSDWGVKPPTVMFGAIKTGDEIVIHYNINLKD